MIAQPNFCQVRHEVSFTYRTQQAMEECNVCAEAIGPLLLDEDLERNSSQEPTKSETYITAKAHKVLPNATLACC